VHNQVLPLFANVDFLLSIQCLMQVCQVKHTFYMQNIESTNKDTIITNDEQALSLIKNTNGAYWHLIDAKLKSNRNFLHAAARDCEQVWQYAEYEMYKQDKQFMLHAVTIQGSHLQYASQELKNNVDLVLAAVNNNYTALRFASHAIKSNPDIILELVKQKAHILEYADSSIKGNYDLVLEAVKQNGSCIIHASTALQKNKAIIQASIKQLGGGLHHNPNIQNNYDYMLEVVKQNVSILAQSKFKDDEQMAVEVIKHNAQAFKYLSRRLKSNPRIVSLAVQTNGRMLEYANVVLQWDYGIVLKAVTQCRWALLFACKKLKYNRNIVRAAYQHCTIKEELTCLLDVEYIKQNKFMFLEFDFEKTRVPKRLSQCKRYYDIVFIQ
jgi:tetratricopeptide (TPR) repeat protein